MTIQEKFDAAFVKLKHEIKNAKYSSFNQTLTSICINTNNGKDIRSYDYWDFTLEIRCFDRTVPNPQCTLEIECKELHNNLAYTFDISSDDFKRYYDQLSEIVAIMQEEDDNTIKSWLSLKD